MKKIILLMTTILVILSVTGCKNNEEVQPQEDSLTTMIGNQYNNESIENSTVKVTGYKKLDVYYMNNIPRQMPTSVTDNGLSQYPAYNNEVTDAVLKPQILQENEAMFDFDFMDQDGYYYKAGIKTGQRLYKHTASDVMYPSKLSDSQTAVEKYMHLNNYAWNTGLNVDSGYGALTTGLYAAPGEIVKIEIPEEAVSQNIEVYIGKMSSKGNSNNIPSSRNYSRFPLTTKGVTLTDTVNYIGNPLGGLVYIYNGGARIDLDVKITGAVEATHYVVNSTTPEDLERSLQSTAPLLEIDIPGQLFANMAKSYCNDLSVDKMLAGIDQWDKMTAVSLYVNRDKNDYTTFGMSALYDSYIPAGAATAVVGHHSVNPHGWANNFFDTSISDWGSYHEYNHHYGMYDIIDDEIVSEVSNNLLTVIGYAMYSEYSGFRTTETSGASGWSGQTRQTYAIDQINNVAYGYGYRLSQYVVLLHSFGVDKFIEFLQYEPQSEIKNNSKADRMFVKAVEVFGYDMSYYFNEFPYGNANNGQTATNLWHVSDDAVNWANSTGLPMFIPVGHEFQLGQTQKVFNDEYTFETILPFGYLEGQKLNINEFIVVPHDMDYEITSIELPEVGQISRKGSNYIYSAKFTPNTVDKFSITVRVFNENHENTQVLNLGLCHQYTGGLINNVKTTIYNNTDNISLTDIDLDDINLDVQQTFDLTNPSTGWILDKNVYTGHALFVNDSALIFNETKDVTLYFKGKGNLQFYMGESYEDMELVSEFSDQANYDLEDRSFTTKVIKDKKLYMRIVCNTDTRCEFGVATHNGSSFANLGDDVFFGVYSSKEDMNTDYYKPLYDYNRFPQGLDGKEMNYTIEPTEGAHIEYQSSNILPSAFHKEATTFGSAAAGTEIIYDFNEIVKADGIAFGMAWAHGRTLKDFEIHFGNDPRKMTKVLDSTATDSGWYEEDFGRTYHFRYAKVVFKSCHYNATIGIYSINFRVNQEVNYFTGTNEELLYTGYANEERLQGSFHGSIVEFNGEVTFNFKGSYLDLYSNVDSKYGFIEIKVDDGEWIKVDLSNETLIREKHMISIRGLEFKDHKVTIRSTGLANIDYITTR